MNEKLLEGTKYIKELTKEQFESLYKFTQILNSVEYQDSLIENVLDIIIEVINAERGLFVKYNKDQNSFNVITARHIGKEKINDPSEFSSGLLQKVINEKKPMLYHDVQSDPNLSQFESVQLQNIKSVIGVPIVKDEVIWGVIIADSRLNRQEFTEENLLFLNYFSSLVSLALDRINTLERLKDENLLLSNKLQEYEQIPELIGGSKKMKELTRLIHKVARTDATVLILGESGTGKDLVATAIHKLSDRSKEPYLAQFCGSIPDNLLESELFGYKKGAFTGANTDKKGLLEVANNGTFFLDEIADISTALQAKLLRVLENKEIIRLGDTQVKKVDVRIITATNKDMNQLVKEGGFREDLFYRLNVFPVKLSPLRERREDIPLLVNHFVKKFAGKDFKIHPSALKKLSGYYWPGNVRQLINVIQRSLILTDSNQITDEHIILEEESDVNNFTGTLKDFELLLLKKRLKEYDGNRTQAAKSLNVSVRWIQLKLKEIDEDS
ncbi:MAG: sigma 54-interacting transcriptional regulator [Bacteroidetes bacterium]|nr:sigma 54-interacting transcriptional regulator [Bacteroidota bacterium]